MNYLKQTERFLKSFLKRKVKLTTGLMVAFLISGSLTFSTTTITSSTNVPITTAGDYILGENFIELNYTDSLINNSNVSLEIKDHQILKLVKTGSSANNGAIYSGNIFGNGSLELVGNIGIGSGETNISINNLKINATEYGIFGYGEAIISSKNIEIFSEQRGIYIPIISDGGKIIKIENYDNLFLKTNKSFALQNTSGSKDVQLNLIGNKNSNTKISTGGTAIFSYRPDSIINISSNNIDINSIGYTLQAQDGQIIINGDYTSITSATEIDENGNCISPNQEGIALVTFNNGVIHINKEQTNKTLQITGIIYAYGKYGSYNATDEIIANFGTETSFFKGNIINTGEGIVKMGFYNGASWENSDDSNLTHLTLNGGKIINNNSLTIMNNSIQMLGSSNGYNSILTGSGSYTSNGDTLLEISNSGNEFNLSDRATLTGNIIVNSGATLENNGVFSIKGNIDNSGKITLNNGTTIDLNGSGVFSNNDGAELVVNSGATAFTNGTATNKGIITLGDTKDNLSKLVNNATLESNGVIKLNDVTEKMSEEDWKTLLEKLSLNNGTINITGAIVKADGTSIYLAGNEIAGDNNTVGDIIDKTQNETSIKVEQDTVIIGSKDESNTQAITDKEINVGGNLTIQSDESSTGVALDNVVINVTNDKNITAKGENHKFHNTNINLIGNSNLVIGDGSSTTSLEISGGSITTDDKPSFIQTSNNSALVLKDINVGIDIVGSEVGTGDVITINTTLDGKLEANNLQVEGKTTANGEVSFNRLVVGKLESGETDIKELFLSSNSKLTTIKKSINILDNSINTVTIANDGQLTIEVADDGSNALGNSSDLTIIKESSNSTSTKEQKADIVFVLADGTTSQKIAIEINESNILDEGLIFALNSEVYILEGNIKDGFYAVYNEALTKDYNEKINELNKLASNTGEYLSLDKDTRIIQLDKLYTNSIYSETVKATYDTVKLNEESILELNIPTNVGEWSAGGKALYNRTQYSRAGFSKDNYNVKTDTSGLLGAMEYGIDENTSIGFAFSGAKQSIKTDTGNADGTILYLGTYGKKESGKYSITGGIGYQFANYSSDNNAGSISTSDNYNSDTLSLYTEGRYSFDLGDNLTIQPKAKLGYTYINQEDTMDNYFGVKDANISTFDVEIGANMIKTVAISNGKVELSLGGSYIRTIGDTDKEFSGEFVGNEGTAKVLGAQLSENTGKFTFDINISKDSGVNYNTGIYLKTGDNSSRNYGASIGLGYTF